MPPESLPVSNTISSLKYDMPTSEPFISKETVKHTSNCELMLKIYHLLSFWKSFSSTRLTPTPGGGGVLPNKRLLGMCRGMGSHFHNCIDYNGVTF